ncbi:MAG: hypothetical protein GWP08_06810 [Nitrospiraceae bacterium]|nr:hypothetical protein [Nitrospiraceae bacterium]
MMRRRRGFGALLLLLLFLSPTTWAQSGLLRLKDGSIEIRYAKRDEATAERARDILRGAMSDYTTRLPAGDAPIHLTIAPSLTAFRNQAGAYGRAQVGGIANPERGAIVVKSPRLLPPGQDYAGLLRHELLHVLIARNTDPANVPRWFNEGIALVVSREIRWSGPTRLARMYVRRRLIPYRELNMAFAPFGNETTFGDAYAQAASMTHHLIDTIGEESFWELVRAMQHTSFEQALRQHAQMTPAELYDTWRRSLWKVALIMSLVSGFSAFHLMVALLLVAFARKRRRAQRLLRQWDEEEDARLFSWDTLERDPEPWEEEGEEDT